MTVAQVQRSESTGQHPASWQSKARRQYYACLAAAGDRAGLESLLSQTADQAEQADLRFYLAAALLRENQRQAALRELKAGLDHGGHDHRIRDLVIRLLLNEAANLAQSGDWRNALEAVSEAAALSKGSQPVPELAEFEHVLPAAYLSSGRRSEAIKIWRERYEAQPEDTRLLHHLTLAVHFGALSCDEQNTNGEALLSAWKCAIAHWTALLNWDAFWESWNRRRNASLAISAEDMAALRKDLLSRTLVHYFQDQVSRHRESGSSEWAQVYEDLQLAQSCEERGSEAWRETLKALNGKLVVEGREKLLLIPGGYLFFEQFQLLPKIQETAKKLPDTATDLMARIAQYLSADGLGFVAVMLDEGRNPGRALELLGQLDNKNGAAALYLHARAKSQLAGQLIEQAKVPEAVGAWKEALQLAQKEPSDFPASMFKALAAKITEEASERINAEAVRLKDAGKLDEAIALVEQCREFGLTDLLCVLFCDRGEKRRADKSFDAAREDFGRVLKLAPDHKRAKEGMAITFNNEGVAAQDTKRRLQLYEKAHEWDPNHSVVRANLAVELREKAIRDITDARAKYNSLGPKKYRAALNAGIALMERAVRLADPAFTAEQLKQLEQQARQGEQRIQGYLSALNEEPLKSTLFNLGMAYLFRFQAPS